MFLNQVSLRPNLFGYEGFGRHARRQGRNVRGASSTPHRRALRRSPLPWRSKSTRLELATRSSGASGPDVAITRSHYATLLSQLHRIYILTLLY